MKTREQVVRFIEDQLEGPMVCARPKGAPQRRSRHHYGAQELRELMDFIYEGEPQTDAERITLKNPNKW